MNIAVVVSGGLSETILATPLIRTLRAGLTDCRITLLCPQTARVVSDGLPGLDEVIPLPHLAGAVGPHGAARVWFELRKRRLDTVLLCTDQVGALLAAYFSGTPQRVGVSHGLNRLLLTAAPTAAFAENLARTWLRLAAALGIRGELHKPSFEPGADAQERAEGLLNSSALADGRLLIAIAPGTAFAATLAQAGAGWDPERYAHLANQLAARHGAGIALVGGQADRDAIERTKLDLGAAAVDLGGATDARTIAAVLARCDLLIGGDTPLLHLAAGVGTPTVGLFGPTDGIRFGPYGSDHRVVQATGNGDRAGPAPATMEQIRVEDVLASIESTF